MEHGQTSASVTRTRGRHAPTPSYAIHKVSTHGHDSRHRYCFSSIPHDETRVQAIDGRGHSSHAVTGEAKSSFLILFSGKPDAFPPKRWWFEELGLSRYLAILAYQQAAASMKWSLGEGAGSLFLTVLGDETKGDVALAPLQLTNSLQAHLRVGGGRRVITWTAPLWMLLWAGLSIRRLDRPLVIVFE